jgi:hypothetical protein
LEILDFSPHPDGERQATAADARAPPMFFFNLIQTSSAWPGTRAGKEFATFTVAAGRPGGGNPAASVQLQGSA